MTGIQGFSYSVKRTANTIYGEGSEPIGVTYGNKAYTASIDVLQSELEAIISAGGGDPFSIAPFTVVHSYTDSETGLALSDVCEGCTFTDITKAMKQNDPIMKNTVPLNVRRIKFNTTNQTFGEGLDKITGK